MQPAPGSAPTVPVDPPQYWLKPGPDMPRRRWQRQTRGWVVAATIIGSIALAAVAVVALVFGALGSSIQVDGAVVLSSQNFQSTNRSCAGTKEYVDLKGGARVRILDEDDRILETGELEAGVLNDGKCRLGFSIGGVERGKLLYTVEIGQSIRHSVSESTIKRDLDFEL